MNSQQYSQQVNLFGRQFVANTLRSHYRCPNCQNEFMHNYQKLYGESHIKSNRPFLLSCGHNLCENCILQNRSNLTCSVCIRPVQIHVSYASKQSQFYVRENFEMNFFLLGAINYYSFSRRNNSNDNSFQKAILPVAAMTPPLELEVVLKCSECENSAAVGICKQCKVNFCNNCFKSVHQDSKVLKRHKLEKLEKSPAHMLKPRICFRHRKPCERYCKTCRLVCCAVCSKTDHALHSCSFISHENEQVMGDVYQLLETIQNSRENLKKAQKDVKSTEKQLHEYATQTLQDISKYFLELHSFLQMEESRIVAEFNELSQPPQEKLREAYSKLSDTQNALNSMQANLEVHTQNVPANILLHEVIAATGIKLEQLPCQVLISKEKMTQNPFSFEVRRDIKKDFAKYIGYEYADPELCIRIGPLYADLNHSIEDTSSKILNTEQHKKRNNKRNQKKKMQNPSSRSVSITPSTSSGLSEVSPTQNVYASAPMRGQPMQKPNDVVVARISQVNSPEHFYIQRDNSLEQISALSNKYMNYMYKSSMPHSISEGNYYMAYCEEDKMWYRAMLKKILSQDLFKMFLIDMGMLLEVPKRRLCDIDDSALAIPFSAIKCAIHDIMPPGGQKWSKEANQLLIEITNNKSVHVNIIERIKANIWKVDVVTAHTADPISLRDSFLYTGLAQERPGVLNFKLQPKKMAPVARLHQRLQKQTYQQGEMFVVHVTHVEDPQEFFVVKLDQIEAKKKMWEELNQPFENLEKEQLYLASLQMCCALKLNDAWHRACVEEIKDGGRIRVRLVDEGCQKTVDWNQLFFLPEKYRQHKQFAIKCALADIEPLQENNYTWTDDAVQFFKQLCANPLLQLFVYSTKASEYKVALHAKKKLNDINIGAMLVKYGYGLSTGEASQAVEMKATRKLPQKCKLNDFEAKEKKVHDDMNGTSNTMNLSASLPSTEKTDLRILERTHVYVRHIETPGEFYVALKKLDAGIRSFHKQIQECEMQRQKLQDSLSDLHIDAKEWFLGDHCVVYTNYKAGDNQDAPAKKNDAQCEYYRGVIVAVELERDPKAPFVIFLRDIGATVQSIRKAQLHEIDSHLDRVTNAVQRCHMACVQPTGGVQAWSQTAIESFKRTVQLYSNIGVTLQGERQLNTNSLPVVLWGMTTETADPLAPCISKYTNINRMLVNSGLAHLVERLDVTKQMDRIMHHELKEGEITIEEWFKKFLAKNKAIILIEDVQEQVIEATENSLDCDMTSRVDILSELNTDTEEPDANLLATVPAGVTTWHKPRLIEKSIFTAYPTYVDYDAVVYLHDTADDVLLKKLRAKIQNIYGNQTLPTQLDINYPVGTPCLAKYHMDNNLYRALVKEVFSENEFGVLFIDYGNVERCEKSELRPFMPFPKLPTIACKYRIEGICPKNGEACYTTDVLDVIHALLVGQLVSVRVPEYELGKDVKSCSMRAGADDAAEYLIQHGYVDAKPPASFQKEHTEKQDVKVRRFKKQPNSLPLDDTDKDGFPANHLADINSGPTTQPRLRNQLFLEIEKNLDITWRRNAGDFDFFGHPTKHSSNDPDVVYETDDEDEQIQDVLDERFNMYLSQLEKEDSDLDNDIYDPVDTVIPKASHNQLTVAPVSKSKKSMFDLDDYKKVQEMQQKNLNYNNGGGSDDLDSNGYDTDHGVDEMVPDDALGLKDDEDVNEVQFSLAAKCWQIGTTNGKKTDSKATKMLEKISNTSNNDLESSGFDKFQPYETSSVFSNIRGINFFKSPQLPPGMRSFFCKVVTILTPVVLHIFPHLAELEYRETELQRRVQILAKKAPSLTKFEANTLCLACYSKDKKWYRALIRSDNPTKKTADVLYVDYLNTETVSVKSLRQYPTELASWPLRTFRVKLAGLQPNPRMREKDIRRALYNVVAGRILHARIENQSPQKPQTNENDEDNSSGTGLQEISLYESKKAHSSMVVYEELIIENFYCRI